MAHLERQVKNIAMENGAAVVGIASRERLADAPPSGDPDYLLPSTYSLISFAIPLDRKILRDFFSKKKWLPHGADQKRIYQTMYQINDALVNFLTGEGHEARGVNGNCVFRPEAGAEDLADLTEFLPDFSHRYGAVAAGLGRLGWSGNLLTPEFGAAVYLGTVLTSAKLRPDPLCETNPCDRCKLCTSVCPVEMIGQKKTVEVTIAGITEEIAEKKPNTRCWIGCGDYHGLSPNRKWSNWTPYRADYPLPGIKADLDALCIRLRKLDPQMHLEPNQYTDHRAVTFDPDWNFTGSCGHCAGICWEKREDREENRRLIVNAGVVVLNADGTRATTHDDIIEIETPFLVRVAVSKPEYEKMKKSKAAGLENKGYLPIDRAVLAAIIKNAP